MKSQRNSIDLVSSRKAVGLSLVIGEALENLMKKQSDPITMAVVAPMLPLVKNKLTQLQYSMTDAEVMSICDGIIAKLMQVMEK